MSPSRWMPHAKTEPAPHAVIACRVLVAAAIAVAIAACRHAPPPREYQLTGQVLAVKPDGSEITIRHHDIKGFMPAMVMPFTVKNPALAKGRLPGDLVKATLLVTDDEAWLGTIEKTGWAPFPESSGETAAAPELLQPGDALPDETFIDQDAKPFRLSALRGSPVLLTFIYTRCPLPEFCPRMDRQFAAVQRALASGAVPGPARLLSISFDPEHDTPAVLSAHAARVGADPRVWTFATAPRATIDAFAGRLGLSVLRDQTDPDLITHNLRTAVIDRQGRLVRVFNGNDWTPDQAVAALKDGH